MIGNSFKSHIPNWTKIDFTPIMKEVKNQWTKLLDKHKNEEEYHKFLLKHAHLFWGMDYFFVISKLKLSDDYVPDFILINETGSFGFEYTLVELKLPSSKVITKKYNPSATLTHSMKQIRDWKNWIAKHSQEITQLFPSKFSSDTTVHIKYQIIIGRRSNNFKKEIERQKLSEEKGYEIRSYDYLSDCLKRFRPKEFVIPNSDVNEDHWENGLFHQFANPFFMALHSNEWKDIVKNPNFDRVHMLGRNTDLILKKMKENKSLRQLFDSYME